MTGHEVLRVLREDGGHAEVAVRLGPDYRGFQGHFPGDPLLPGMCHVALALRAAGRVTGTDLRLVAVERARFSRKVRPGSELRILLSIEPEDGEATISATHRIDDADVAEIVLRAAVEKTR